MNLFLDASKWEDNDGSPPIWWTGSRYEIFINNDGSAEGMFYVYMSGDAAEGDTIKFSYEVSNWDPAIGYSDGYINIVKDEGAVVASAKFADQSTGELSIECEAGSSYSVMVAYSSSDYYSGNFYDFEAILTPTPDEEPEPETVKPWWLCNAKEPVTPCPVRPTTFVPLDEYDVDFKFPLTSSRVESKIVRPEECMVCRPVLINEPDPGPDPDPEPTCIDIEFYGGCGCIDTLAPSSFLSKLPDWFSTFQTFELTLDTGSGTVFGIYSPSDEEDGTWFYKTDGDSLYGPLEGTGTLTQNFKGGITEEICVNYTIHPGS